MARGGYTVRDLIDMTDEQISFIYHYQNLVEQKREDFLASALGVMWSKEDFKKGEGSGPPPDKVFLPLSVALNPNVSSYVSGLFGMSGTSGEKASAPPEGYRPEEGEEVVSMSSLDKDSFLKMIGKR